MLILGAGSFLLSSCSTFGTPPEVKVSGSIERSLNYDKQRGQFVNRRPDIIEQHMKENLKFMDRLEWFRSRPSGTPAKALPQVKPNLSEFVKKSDSPRVIWFGHSSLLINLEGKIILIDPVFSGSASPFSFMVKRFQKPVLQLTELPEIDYIVISHDHYDHLDIDTIKFFKDKKCEFLVPLGVGSHLKGWGIDSKRITELDWWSNVKKGGIEFVSTPAQHFSGRSFLQKNKTLWSSWVIRTAKSKLFFSGDSGYDVHFKEIGKRYGPFDIAFMETGQYNKRWKPVHMLPHEAAKACLELNAKRYFPVHWGMFELAFHTWYDPALDISHELDLNMVSLLTPKLGEILEINSKAKTSKWWEPIVAEIKSRKQNKTGQLSMK